MAQQQPIPFVPAQSSPDTNIPFTPIPFTPATPAQLKEEGWWEFLTKPRAQMRTGVVKEATDAYAKENPWIGRPLNFIADALSSQTSLLAGGTASAGLAMPVVSRVLPAVAKPLDIAFRTGAGLTALQGAQDIYTGETAEEKVGGGLSAVLGTLGARYSMLPKEAPVVKPGQRLLNAPRYAGGPTGGSGAVQLENLVNADPRAGAELAGVRFQVDPDGTIRPAGIQAQPSGTALEIPRPDKPAHYTAHEAAGGTSLATGDSVNVNGIRFTVNEKSEVVLGIQDIPTTAGETGAGFTSVSPELGVTGKPLPYPLNVVPEAVRPRSAQTVTRALGGEQKPETPLAGTKRPESTLESGTVAPETIPFTPDTKAGGTAAIAEGETILPGKKTVNPDIEKRKAAAIQQWRINNPKEAAIIDQQRKIRDAAVQRANDAGGINLPPNAVERVPPIFKRPMAQMIVDLWNQTWVDAYTRIHRLSPELWRRSNRAVHQERQFAAEWGAEYQAAIEKLSKTEFANMGHYVEGTLPIPSQAVANAVAAWKKAQNMGGDTAVNTKLPAFADVGGEVELVPFEKHPGDYWPHIGKEPYYSADLVQRLVDKGIPRAEAVRIKAHLERTGELKIGAQFRRKVASEFPYRYDAGAGLQHIRSLARRVAQNIEFGPKDIMGKGSEGIADLMEATSNPTEALELMTRIIRGGEAGRAAWLKALELSRVYSTITKLKNFTIPNLVLGHMSTAYYARRHPISAVKEFSKLFEARYRDKVRASGAMQNFGHTMAEEMGTRWDWYKIGGIEEVNRRTAAAIGRSVAREAFADLKRNPKNKQALKELSELILEPVENLLRQDFLTENQLKMASGRAAEITQSLNVPGNLPVWASDPAKGVGSLIQQLMWQFKKTGYQQTRMLLDTLDPRQVGIAGVAKNAAIWTGLTGLAGEIVLGSKAGWNALWGPSSIGEERQKRAEWWLEGTGIAPEIIQRASDATGLPPEEIALMAESWTQAYFGGLPMDLISSSTRSPTGILTGMAGPIPTDASKLINFLTTLNFDNLGREILKNLPIPGAAGIEERIAGTEEEPGLMEQFFPGLTFDEE